MEEESPKHLLLEHYVPVFLLPVATSGFSCFAWVGLRSSALKEVLDFDIIYWLGFLGTIEMVFFFFFIGKRPRDWQALGLGRAAWSILIVIAWFAGVGCGALLAG
jgi:hypothetical protein